MIKNKYYTLGEIFRLGLLRTRKGKAYKHKATVRDLVLAHLKYKRVKSKWGDAFSVSESEIKRYNSHKPRL